MVTTLTYSRYRQKAISKASIQVAEQRQELDRFFHGLFVPREVLCFFAEEHSIKKSVSGFIVRFELALIVGVCHQSRKPIRVFKRDNFVGGAVENKRRDDPRTHMMARRNFGDAFFAELSRPVPFAGCI